MKKSNKALPRYKTGGLSLLLEEPPKTGRPKILDVEEVKRSTVATCYLSVAGVLATYEPTIQRIVRAERL